MNRCFSKQDRKHLYLVADGRCAKCRGDLLDDWEAHHIKRYADGGLTSLTNAVAVCRRCHVEIHRGQEMKPRDWQEEAFNKFKAKDSICYLLEATPGAGKTIFAGFCAQHMLDSDCVDFVVCVVPTTALKDSFVQSFHGVGVEIAAVLKEARGRPNDFSGAVITYAQLPNIVSTFETWSRNGARLMFVFDEIHHASEYNIWGQAAETCGRISTKILGMTGTPFRGDGARISFVRYDHDGVVIPDHKYTYRQAVAEHVCRQVLFVHDDGVAEYMMNEQEENVVISEAQDDQVSKVSSVIFRRNAEWLEKVLGKADEKLDEYRISDVNAGGLIVCRPGNSEEDDRHLQQVAKCLRDQTGYDPVVITHDDPEANAKIEKFRKGDGRWIIAVRKISEGVDIKRLRVLVIASYPGTELLFRQIVGRVVRHEDKSVEEDSTVYMAKFPRLVEFASRISDEAEAGLAERREREAREAKERNEASPFTIIGSSHVDGGGISSLGEQFDSVEIECAESIKRGDRQLASVSVAAIAHLLRKVGYAPEASNDVGEPLYVQKKRKREEINKLVRQAAIRLSESSQNQRPNFSLVWTHIHNAIGVKDLADLMDNHDISKMDAAIDVVKNLLKKVSSHAA